MKPSIPLAAAHSIILVRVPSAFHHHTSQNSILNYWALSTSYYYAFNTDTIYMLLNFHPIFHL